MGCSTVLLASAAGGGTKAHREIHNARRTVKLGGRGGVVAAATCNVDILAAASSPSTSCCSSLSRSVAPAGSSSSTPASALHKLVCRVRSGWRRQAAALCAGGGSGSRPRFGYDFESYCRNFDDGCCRD